MNKNKPIQYNRLSFFMKVTLIHVLISSFSIAMAHAIAGSGQEILDRKVTLDKEGAAFKSVLLLIGKQVNVKFAYSPELLEEGKRISIHVQNEKLSDVLSSLLSPDVSFKVVGKQIVLMPPKQIIAEQTEEEASVVTPDIKVSGKVTDVSGAGMPGVNVVVKGTTIGVTTNADGIYTIDVPDGEAILIFSFIGYASQEVLLGNNTKIDVSLVEDISQLGEVVVTALGVKKDEKALGYSVSTVSAEQLTVAGNTNFASALYGKAAGVKITTAPGGAGSAVNVQIRGINSINYNQQPLYVVDGIMIRNDGQNGAAGANNNSYDSDQRIRGNGILDINPADIETLSVLKGASASALYGSDAASGVIVITTKKGSRKKGLGVDFNYSGTVEKVAFLPKLQNVYGPGYDRATNLAIAGNAEGKITEQSSPSGFRPYFRAYGQFGPKLEGQQVKWWDGSIRSFSAQPDNYRDVFDVGYSSNANISISNQTDRVNYRFSATRLDYKSTNPGSKQQKNTFNLNSTIKLNDKISTDVVVSYINTFTHNRAYQLGQVLNSYGGYFSRAEDIGLMRQKFQTTDGYKYSTLGTGRPEDFIYNIRATNLLDFYWNQLKNSYDETENRLLTSATLNWDVVNHFKVRGRIGSDYTGRGVEEKRYNENALAYNSSSQSTGAYVISSGIYSILYGDVLGTYSNKIGEDFDFSISGGYQSRSESYKDQTTSTQGGLVTENWFSISNSYTINSNSFSGTRKSLLKYAYLGMLNLSYKNYLFLEATARKEYASTLPPQNNNYFYPSVNASFVFSDAFQLPAFLSYGKLRASYGVVGNAPPMYESNVVYSQKSLQTTNGSVPALYLSGGYGNNTLKSEKKTEQEVGLETRFFDGRFGIDVSYYSNTIQNQILNLSTSPSNGATSQIVNVGEIGSKGIEIALNAKPLTGNLKWDVSLNFSSNRSRVVSLAPGIPEIVFYSAGGALKLVAGAGERLGNIYVKPREKDSNGNYVINSDGYYVIAQDRYEKVGNIMPKAIGGLSNTITYKNVSLYFIMDYRFGGQLVSTPMNYQTNAGLYKNTLQYRDAAHGGLTYTQDGVTYDDGVLLKGVVEGTGEQNTKIITAADYYLNTFSGDANSWNEKGMVYDNSYIKMREAALSYRVPSAISSKMKLNNIRISFIGRNLFYVWKTLENLDPEAPLGNKWWSQGVDVGSSAATRSYGFSLNASF